MPGEFHEQRSLAGHSPWGRKESDMTEQLTHTHMRELMGDGTTTILVSHSMQQIREMCTQVVWLEKGEMRGIGDTKTMCDMYEKYMKK